MLRPCVRRIVPITAALALAMPVEADPVSATYTVQLSTRCTETACGAFELSFPLTLRINATPTEQSVSATFLLNRYGVPSFSSIPLERPAVASGASVVQHATEIGVLLDGDTPWRHIAHVFQGYQTFDNQFFYRWSLAMGEIVDGVSPPALDSKSFLAFLGRGINEHGFGYAYSAIRRSASGGELDETVDSISYQGRLLADAAEPVPEPSTLLLLATGGAAIARQVWRKRLRSES